jgi:hypothetical protein
VELIVSHLLKKTYHINHGDTIKVALYPVVVAWDVYGRDPSLAGYSVANPQPAPVITQVTQHMQIPLSYADAIIGSSAVE